MGEYWISVLYCYSNIADQRYVIYLNTHVFKMYNNNEKVCTAPEYKASSLKIKYT